MWRAIHALTRFRVAAAIIAAAIVTAPATAEANDPVLEWNDIARTFIVVPALSPVQQTRAMAIVQVAMHDAVNGITGEYGLYQPGPPAPAGASPEAAAIGAAFRVLRSLFGDVLLLNARYAASLVFHGITLDDPGLAFGDAVGAGILQLRRDDGAGSAAYVFIPESAGEVGTWTPLDALSASQSLLPGWGSVTPFVLRNAAQFRPDPPPALSSETYARDYNEVKEIGAAQSSVRTDSQTQIALFWRASPTALWNPILRTAIESKPMNLSETARAMALFYLAASDASVACWEAKYVYNFWRPQAAIRRGDEDGNDATIGDPTWTPRIGTPPHPDYVSGHAANSGAMAFVLAQLFGESPGYMIEGSSSQNPGFLRRWLTFSEGVKEVIDARVYSGIHFRTADEVGARLGRQVAQFIMTHALRPTRPNR